MEDTIIIGDTHFGISNSSEFFLDIQRTFFTNLYKHMKANGIARLVHVGDLFDNRRSVDYRTLRNAFEIFTHVFNDDPDIEVYIIVGNHDAYYKNTLELNSITQLLDWTTFHIVDRPREFKFDKTSFLMVPWICPANYDEVHHAIENSTADILCGHFDIAGFKMTDGLYSMEGLSVKAFQQFNHVFSGHFHIGSTQGNITYVGAPYQLNWNDAKESKSVVVFDTAARDWDDKKVYSLSERTFIKIEEWSEEIDPAVYSGKVLKVYIDERTDKIAFDRWHKRVLETGVHKISVIENMVDATVNPDDIDISKDTMSLLYDYVDKYYKDEDAKMIVDIKKLIMKMYEAAQTL